MAKTLIVDLLGGFRAEVDGRPVPDGAWRHRRGATLVKILALAPNHRMHREQLMDILWPELGPEAAAANLRKATHFARRALGGEDAIGTDGAMVALCPGGRVTVDVEEFSSAVQDAMKGDGGARDVAIRRYRGELLPEDRYADWAEPHRERLRSEYVGLLRASQMWERVLQVDPGDEEAHRALMRAHLEAGNRRAALVQFGRLREILRADLGVGPDEETVVLYEEALAQEGREPPDAAGRARALIAWGLVHWNRRDLDDARTAAEQARALALDAGLSRELGEASALLGLVAFAHGQWQQTFRAEFESSVTRTPDMTEPVFDAHLCLADFALYGADWNEAIAPFARELQQVAVRAGSVHGEALTTLVLGEVELLSGNLSEAEGLLTRAAQLHQMAGATSGQALSTQRLAEVWMARGKRRKAVKLLSDARILAGECALIAHLLVRVWGSLVSVAPDPAEKLGLIEEAGFALSGMRVCGPCSVGFHVASATAFAQAGDPPRARTCLAEAERIAGMWQGGPWVAATWEARAALRKAEGQPEQASALLQEAADLFASSGRPLDEARCRAAAS